MYFLQILKEKGVGSKCPRINAKKKKNEKEKKLI